MRVMCGWIHDRVGGFRLAELLRNGLNVKRQNRTVFFLYRNARIRPAGTKRTDQPRSEIAPSQDNSYIFEWFSTENEDCYDKLEMEISKWTFTSIAPRRCRCNLSRWSMFPWKGYCPLAGHCDRTRPGNCNSPLSSWAIRAPCGNRHSGISLEFPSRLRSWLVKCSEFPQDSWANAGLSSRASLVPSILEYSDYESGPFSRQSYTTISDRSIHWLPTVLPEITTRILFMTRRRKRSLICRNGRVISAHC